MKHLFPYRWNLADGYPAKGMEAHGRKVFGTFICGGGSTMGYKLAGYTHVGGVEIDPEVAAVYRANHNPKHLFIEDIRAFNKRVDLPDELFDLDILDGSPPCSSFSMAGNREKDWGKAKVFREGQAHQTLDDLFFDFIALAKRLQPKVVIAENVKGLIQGNAKAYVKRIKREIEEAGYKVQLFLLNAASMGVPQRRERVFFIAQRNDMGFPALKLEFSEPGVVFGAFSGREHDGRGLSGMAADMWSLVPPGNSFKVAHPKGHWFNTHKVSLTEVPPTVSAQGGYSEHIHPTWPRRCSAEEVSIMGTFPTDYVFDGIAPAYLIGMSVPPVMTAQIAHQINVQWFANPRLN